MLLKLRTSYLLSDELIDVINFYQQTLADGGVISDGKEKSATREPFIEKIITLLEADRKHLRKALTAVRTNPLIKKVREADIARDEAFKSFKQTVHSAKYRKKKEVKAAFELVWPVIESTGTLLYRSGMIVKSGKLDALFEKLDEATYKQTMNSLNVAEIFQELKQAHKDFQTIYDLRFQQQSKLKFPTMKAARAQLIVHLTALMTALGVLYDTSPKTYKSLIEKINALTKEIMTVARARKTLKKKKQEANDSQLLLPQGTGGL